MREPGGGDAGGVQRLLDGQRLLRSPRRPLVDRAEHAGRDPGQRLELLDRRIRAVHDHGARLEQRSESVRALEPIGPEALGEVAVGRSVRELHRARDSERGEARQILGRQALDVLDPLAQPPVLPGVAGRLERVERVPIRLVADRVHRDRPASLRTAANDLLQLFAARDLDAAAVGEERSL